MSESISRFDHYQRTAAIRWGASASELAVLADLKLTRVLSGILTIIRLFDRLPPVPHLYRFECLQHWSHVSFQIREWRSDLSHTNQTHITQIHIFNFNLGSTMPRIIDGNASVSAVLSYVVFITAVSGSLPYTLFASIRDVPFSHCFTVKCTFTCGVVITPHCTFKGT
uniref:Uncharacterized protein n=1 Tax=Escherichia coli TaxID=562 RepID=A0A6D1NXL9_ECOLX|nr:hypothetical protein [Escherichia coli]